MFYYMSNLAYYNNIENAKAHKAAVTKIEKEVENLVFQTGNVNGI